MDISAVFRNRSTGSRTNKPLRRLRTLHRALSRHESLTTALAALSLLAVFIAFLAILQFSTPALLGTDGYYHIKLAYLMRVNGLKPAFEWLPMTILAGENFVDHHFLFHVALIPFTFGDLAQGAKLAGVLFPAFTFLALWWVLRANQVPSAALWALAALAVSDAFLFRMSMPRAQSLSLLFLLLGVHWLLAEKYRLLLPLGFLYVWLYNGFPLLLVLAGLYTAARFVLEKQLHWQPLVFAFTGIFLGLVINPYFPENLVFNFHHIVPKLINPTEAARVGREWYPYTTAQLLENSGGALLLAAAGFVMNGARKKPADVHTLLSTLLLVLFGFTLFQSRRFIEYFPAFTILFAAFAARPFVEDLRRERRLNIPGTVWAQGLMAALLIWGGAYSFQAARANFQSGKPDDYYRGAAVWLRENTAPGTRVFHTDWDDFPRLFFYNAENTYLAGLDPTYMQLYDAELYDTWTAVSKGRTAGPSSVILDEFDSSYVFTDQKHTAFLEAARNDPRMHMVYEDDYAAVFHISPPLLTGP